jgi:hypothetical protein
MSNIGTFSGCACSTIPSPGELYHVSVTLEHPPSAHARLFIVLVLSDDMSVNLEHPTSAHGDH